MQDNWKAAGNYQDLGCNAKEVSINTYPNGTKIIDVTIIDGCAFPGDFATVNIVASLDFNSDRLDVGVYSALDGGDALTGECAVDILDPASPGVLLVDGPRSETLSGGYTGSFDAKPRPDPDDSCGDIGGGGGTLDNFVFQTLKLKCIDDTGDGLLDFTTCFSWRTSGNDAFCTGNQADVYPGNVAKCDCEVSNIAVPVPGRIIIKKVTDPSPDIFNASFDFVLTGEIDASGNPFLKRFLYRMAIFLTLQILTMRMPPSQVLTTLQRLCLPDGTSSMQVVTTTAQLMQLFFSQLRP